MQYSKVEICGVNTSELPLLTENEKDELLKNVWEDEFIGEGTLAVHVRHLREKIEKDPREPRVIKTVWGVGYLLEKYEELS